MFDNLTLDNPTLKMGVEYVGSYLASTIQDIEEPLYTIKVNDTYGTIEVEGQIVLVTFTSKEQATFHAERINVPKETVFRTPRHMIVDILKEKSLAKCITFG